MCAPKLSIYGELQSVEYSGDVWDEERVFWTNK